MYLLEGIFFFLSQGEEEKKKILKYKCQVIAINLFPLACENTGFEYALYFELKYLSGCWLKLDNFVFSVAVCIRNGTEQPLSSVSSSVQHVAVKQEIVMSMPVVSSKLPNTVLSQNANIISY